MSKFFNKSDVNQSSFNVMADNLKGYITSNKATGFAEKIVSIEGFAPGELQAIQANMEQNEAQVRSAMAAAGLNYGFESFNVSNPTAQRVFQRAQENALQAGAITLEAASNPGAYMNNRAISTESAHSTYDFTSGQYAIEVGIQPNAISTEAFENNALNAAMPFSVAYNVACSSQDEFSEAFYPTIVVAPDQIGFIAEIRLQSIYNGMQHRKWNEISGQDKRLLKDAYRDSGMLRQEAVKIVPHFDEARKEELKEMFADEAHVKPYNVILANQSVRTAPLRFGKRFDLLALSEHAGLLKNKTFDETDQLDAAITLAAIYVKVGNQIVKLVTRGLARTQFQRPQEGHEKDLILNFVGDEFVIDAEHIKDIGGQNIEVLKNFTDQGYTLRYELRVTGDANVNSAMVNVATPVLTFVESKNAITGEIIALDSKHPAKTQLDAIKIEPLYFDLDANRTNSNFRTQGPLIDTDAWTEKYIIGIRSPIMIQKPIGQEKDEPTLENLITGTRLRQTHDAMHTLLQYRDTLKNWVNSPANKHVPGQPRRIGNFIGLGKYLIVPFYEYVEIDMKKILNSISSSTRMEDIRAAVVTCLQEVVARGYRDSEYNVALQIDAQGKQPDKPHVTIGTDAYLTTLLSIQGDTRLLGAAFDHTVVQSNLYEMNDKMFLTFTRPSKTGFDPLSFGNTLYYPELIVAVTPYQKNGATVNATQISPRYQHINNLPFLIEVDVRNMNLVTHKLQELYIKDVTNTPDPKAAKPGSTGNPAGTAAVTTAGAQGTRGPGG